ncbi:AF4/FMR2 family member 2 isoform X4 [Polyodon spathula]|uniref:AF4/FMR2 family member 2 isoform X4 n=1 Tax=Polyodon spathula TaxID=7913 RepID=UPI001B7F1597|nr:AF4/FMR2 family member 2 isoform X4 [Polyodon spathula]
MDLFEFDFFRDWELEQQCHYEQDRNALKKKEWERRTQEVQQDEDLFSSGFNLFGEPYKTEASSQSTLGGTYNPVQVLKTNKGDALANRVQNTLGNYDEMKDLLTNHSNQSHLVGIPKNSVPQTPVEKTEQQSFFPEGQRSRLAPSTSMPPPPSSSSSSGPLTSSSLLHAYQSSKKSRSSDWSRGGQSGQASGQQCSRTKHSSCSHEPPQRGCEDLCSSRGDVHKGDSSPAASSSHSRRHAHSSRSAAGDHAYKESTHSKSPMELDFSSHGSNSPIPSTSLISGGLSTPNFPPALHSKPSMVQQKPTAYVRPMDGQDQVPNDSPELKPTMEIGDTYSNPPFGGLLEGKASSTNTKSKLPKLTLPQSGEVSLSNDSSCVEEILREMTHSWPPPLTAIHTPGKAEQTKFPIPSKEPQHLPSGYNGPKHSDAPNKAASKPVPQKSMLEDDLKLSSDDEDSEQTAEKTKPRSSPVNLPVPPTRTAESGHSSGTSGSSSESESSSESDSDSESSSSSSECNEGSRSATPEPEPPATNKWQLDKWLNKVTPHNKALINSQTEGQVLPSAQSEDSRQNEGPGQGKGKASEGLPQPEVKERALLSPIRERAKPRTGQKTLEGKSGKLKSPAQVDLAPPRRTTGKKQPSKVERAPSVEEYNWPKPNNPSSTPKEKEPPPVEQPKARSKGGSGKTAPRKEQRSNTAAAPPPDKKKHRGVSKIVPKSKEFIETESSSSECHSDQEDVVKIPAPCVGPSITGSSLKPKDCSSNSLSVSSTSIDPASSDLLDEHFFSPAPMVQNELLSPLREFEEIKSLWVKIELSFLSRIPGQDPPEPDPVKPEPRDANLKHRRQTPASTAPEKPPSKSKRKHKSENSDALSGNKKLRLEKSSALLPPCISPIHNHKPTSTKDSSKQQPRKREAKLLPPPLSPLSDEPLHSESSSLSQENSTSSSSSHKHRKGDSKPAAHTKAEEELLSRSSSSFHGNGQTEPDLWSTLSPVLTEPRRPKLTFDDTLHNADYYMQEAKKLKHKADALLEKFGKAVNYADGALSFIDCGNAMERDPLEAKSPYTMYSETVELIRYAMRLKNFTGKSSTVADKKLSVLCYRCLSLLYLRMFKLKKDHAMKYSRSLMEYFKNSVKSSQAPSPWGGNGKSTGTPSPTSLSPSPVSSVGSSVGTGGSSSSSGSIAIPQRIHHMAASHVNITNNILRSYEHWDTADKLSRESREFFQELDSVMEPLTQHSSMTSLVRYVRQGLHWLRIEAHLL